MVLCREEPGAKGANADVLRFSHFVQGELDSSGHLVYVAASDGQIQAVNPATHEVVRTSKDAPLRNRRVMQSSATLSPDGRLWYLPIKIPNNGEQGIEQILVFDTQTMSLANIITPVGPFWGLALSSDGRQLYASQPDLQNVLVIDTETHRTVRTLAVGGKPSILFSVKAP
jgi:DNA-binding beta-propeller fold protein YncE